MPQRGLSRSALPGYIYLYTRVKRCVRALPAAALRRRRLASHFLTRSVVMMTGLGVLLLKGPSLEPPTKVTDFGTIFSIPSLFRVVKFGTQVRKDPHVRRIRTPL